MRRHSLTTRLTLSHMLVTLAGLLLLGIALLALVHRSQRAQTLANLAAQADVYAAYAGELAADTAALSGIAPSIVQRFNIGPDVTVRLLAPNGAVLFSNGQLGAFPSGAAAALLPNPLPIQPVTIEAGRRFAAQRITRGGAVIGVVEVSQTVRRETALLRQLARTLVVSAVLALAAAAAVGHLLARSLARPLHRLQRVAANIASGDPTARSDDHSRDEIGQVAAQLNSMADELQRRFEAVEQLADARQQFYRTVSHELRTPLTAIRGTAENLEDDATPEQHAALAVIQSESARLQRLVEELLIPGERTPAALLRHQIVDVATLVQETAQIMRPRAERSGIRLEVASEPRLRVHGDADRLKQALLNLLDNALTWTPPGGCVQLDARADNDEVQISVGDTGPGIAPAVREQVWERGFSTGGGQGVGLALVRAVAMAHGGTARLAATRGTTVELRLPRAAEGNIR